MPVFIGLMEVSRGDSRALHELWNVTLSTTLEIFYISSVL